MALGIGLPVLDRRVDDRLPGWSRSTLFGGDADAARTVLDGVASSLITVTSLTFSLTVVTLQLASSQFSPRLLRTFARDLFVQAPLAVFVGTFAYALTVLRAVRATPQVVSSGVPALSVTAAVVLALVSVFVLVLFLAHLAAELRVWPLPDRAGHRVLLADLGQRVWDTIATGTEGTAVQDVWFGLRQLTDVTIRALSPGINDPTTAVHALDQTTALLCDLARHRLGDRAIRDDDGVLRDRRCSRWPSTPAAAWWSAA